MPKVRALLEEARHIANASHDRKTLAETEWNLAQITASSWNNPKSALPYGLSALELARATNDKELEARSLLAVDRKSTRLNSSHANISYAVFCLKKKKTTVIVILTV